MTLLKTTFFWLQVGALMLGAYLIFFVPWLVPPSRRVVSFSYEMGFNNSLSVLGVLLTVLLLCLIRIYKLSSTLQDKAGIAAGKLLDISETYQPASLKPLRILCALSSLAFIGWFWILPFSYFGEMTYLLSRVDLILLGQVPYRDFQFNYGPLFLYFPAALVRLSANGLSPDLAYLIALITFMMAGLGALFYVVNSFNLNPKHKTTIFWLVALSGFNLSMGMNYTFVRFVLPYFLLIALHRGLFVFFETLQSPRYGRILLKTTLAGALAFWVSPETGIAFACAISVYYWLQFQSESWKWRLCGVFSTLLSIASLGLFSTSYLTGILAFGGGGNNFPVVPSLPVLFFLLSLFAIVPLLVTSRKKLGKPQTALAYALAIAMLVLIAPAFGRCDLGHILFNGLGVFIFSLALLSTLNRRFFRIYAVMFALIFGVVGQLVFWIQAAKPMIGAVAMRQAKTGKINRNFLIFKPSRPASPMLAQLEKSIAPYPKVGTPLGCEEEIEMMLKRSHRYVPEYHPMPYPEIMTESNLERKLADISKMPAILLPVPFLKAAPIRTREIEKSNSARLSVVLLYPIDYRIKKSSLAINREMRNYVHQNYVSKRRIGDLVLMSRKVGQAAFSDANALSGAPRPPTR